MIWLSWSRGWAWNRTPIQPWHSLVPLKLRAETVSANTKKAVVSPRLSRSRLEVQRVLVVEHRFQPLPANVAIALAIDGVAHGHVVGRHALGDRARRPADAEEPADHFLPGADLGKRAIAALIEIGGQRLAFRIRAVGERTIIAA